jgi:hypothetical protein
MVRMGLFCLGYLKRVAYWPLLELSRVQRTSKLFISQVIICTGIGICIDFVSDFNSRFLCFQRDYCVTSLPILYGLFILICTVVQSIWLTF